MTDKLEGDKYLTAHMVWPTYLRLQGLLIENEDDELNEASGIQSLTAVMKQLGRAYAKKNDADMYPTFYHQTMTFLNPTMRKLPMISYVEKSKLHSEIEAYIKKNIINKTVETGCPVPNNALDPVSEDFFQNFESFDNGKKFLAPLSCNKLCKQFLIKTL